MLTLCSRHPLLWCRWQDRLRLGLPPFHRRFVRMDRIAEQARHYNRRDEARRGRDAGVGSRPTTAGA